MRESDGEQRHVLCLFDLIHRGFQIHKALEQRAAFRRRRTRHLAVRKTGSFNIHIKHGAMQGISHKYCTVIQRGDGYGYHLSPLTSHHPFTPKKERGKLWRNLDRSASDAHFLPALKDPGIPRKI